ncbi:hypothetical protein [Leuconostoc citreum]
MEYASIIGIAFVVVAAFIGGVVVGDGLRDKNDKTRTQSAK